MSIWVLNTSRVRISVFLRVGEFSAIISLNRFSLPLVCTSVLSILWILGSLSWLYRSLGIWWSLSFVYFIDFVINPRSVFLVKVTGDGLHCMITGFIEVFNVQAFCGFFVCLFCFVFISGPLLTFLFTLSIFLIPFQIFSSMQLMFLSRSHIESICLYVSSLHYHPFEGQEAFKLFICYFSLFIII